MSSPRWPMAIVAVTTPTVGNTLGLLAWPVLTICAFILMEAFMPAGVVLLLLAGAAPGIGRSMGLVTHRKRLLILAPIAGIGSSLAFSAGMLGALFSNMSLWSGPPPGLQTANNALLGFLGYGAIPVLADLVFELLIIAALSGMRTGAGISAAAGIIGAFFGASCIAWGVGFGGTGGIVASIVALALCVGISAGGGSLGLAYAQTLGWFLEEDSAGE